MVTHFRKTAPFLATLLQGDIYQISFKVFAPSGFGVVVPAARGGFALCIPYAICGRWGISRPHAQVEWKKKRKCPAGRHIAKPHRPAGVNAPTPDFAKLVERNRRGIWYIHHTPGELWGDSLGRAMYITNRFGRLVLRIAAPGKRAH